MHHILKGALAASVAAALLCGGAGSLAYWNATDVVSGGSITAGDLRLDAASCDTAGWTVTNTVEGVSNRPFDLATQRVVPGDVLKKSCTVSITAVGENLRATLGVSNGGSGSGTTMGSSDFSITSSFLLGGSPLSSVTRANNGQTIAVVLTVDFPRRSVVDNASKLTLLDLDDYTVTATQVTS